MSLYKRQHDPKLLATKARSMWAITVFSFFSHVIDDGMKVVLIVYLTLAGYSAGDAAWVFPARAFGFLAFAPFAGGIVDSSSRTKLILLLATLVTVIPVLGLIWTHHMTFVIPMSVIGGAASTFLLPARNALTLGIDPIDFEAKTIRHEKAKAIGSFVTYVLAAVIAYYVYPDIQYVFVIVQLGSGLISCLCLCFVEDYTIDSDDARGAKKGAESAQIEKHLRKKQSGQSGSGGQRFYTTNATRCWSCWGTYNVA